MHCLSIADIVQRLKGAIDLRIAEEQARQKAAQASPSRSNSGARRSSSRTVSPSKRLARAKEREKRINESGERGPDPSDFERDSVLEDEEARSRAGTPAPGAERSGGGENGVAEKDKPPGGDQKEANGENREDEATPAPVELPTEVRVKLRKLDKLESRYQGNSITHHSSRSNTQWWPSDLLRSYRLAHARVLLIEPFETSLRENTPLTSIGDPGALVEYLNQLNLKGDMVLDELKRVSNERDAFKQKLQDAEKSTREAWDEVANLRRQQADIAKPKDDTSGEDSTSLRNNTQTTTTNSAQDPPVPAPTIAPSPLPELVEPKEAKSSSEELFSYDNELPRMEAELRARQEDIAELKSEVETLKSDLAVARESTGSMAQSLEDATRELNVLRDSKDRLETESQEQRSMSERTENDLNSKLQAAEQNLANLKSELSDSQDVTADLKAKLRAADESVEKLRSEQREESATMTESKQLQEESAKLLSEISSLRSTNTHSEKRNDTLNGIVKHLKEQLSEADSTKEKLKLEIKETTEKLEALQSVVAQSKPDPEQNPSTPTNNDNTSARPLPDPTNGTDKSVPAKKKNKKKKKPGKTPTEQGNGVKDAPPGPDLGLGSAHVDNEELSTEGEQILTLLRHEIDSLRQQIIEKDNTLERMHRKARNDEDLRDEIESLRDDLINVGQGHVEAKDKVKELQVERYALEERVHSLEKELADIKASSASDTVAAEDARKNLTAEFEELKMKAATLQTDLSAAEQLAAARFRDLTNLREMLQQAQPELKSLRSEVADLRATKDELGNKATELKRLESRHQDMSAEVSDLKSTIADRDSEIKALNQKIAQETNGRLRAENAHNTTQASLQTAEQHGRAAQESLGRLQKDLARAEEDASTSGSRVRDLEQQVAKLHSDSEGLREEIELKTAQYASAQSLMASMRDQTAEMAMQMKEARERCESLDEELGDGHRLLSERSREGETMRKLLLDIEGRADSRVREMKDRMESAIEERDRIEDESSAINRKRARELEDLKSKVREAERGLKRAEEDKDELEASRKEWKRKREELEAIAEQSSQELNHVRQAMGELRDALDESERQARELESEKGDLRKTVEETRHRLEKLQKSNKVSRFAINPSFEADLREGNGRRTAITAECQSQSTGLRSSIFSLIPGFCALAVSAGFPSTQNKTELSRWRRQQQRTRSRKHGLCVSQECTPTISGAERQEASDATNTCPGHAPTFR